MYSWVCAIPCVDAELAALVGVYPTLYFFLFRRYELATLVGVLEEFDARQPAGEERFYWLDIVTVNQNFDGAPPPFQW